MLNEGDVMSTLYSRADSRVTGLQLPCYQDGDDHCTHHRLHINNTFQFTHVQWAISHFNRDIIGEMFELANMFRCWIMMKRSNPSLPKSCYAAHFCSLFFFFKEPTRKNVTIHNEEKTPHPYDIYLHWIPKRQNWGAVFSISCFRFSPVARVTAEHPVPSERTNYTCRIWIKHPSIMDQTFLLHVFFNLFLINEPYIS